MPLDGLRTQFANDNLLRFVIFDKRLILIVAFSGVFVVIAAANDTSGTVFAT
jgi:hypothetical protein